MSHADDMPLWLLIVIALLVALAILLVSGCSAKRAAKKVPPPPDIDLCGYGTESSFDMRDCMKRLNGVI